MDDRTRDELAGVVDLFGGLTRDELADALLELAFKRGQDVDEDAVDATIAAAIEDYYLVEVPIRYILDSDDPSLNTDDPSLDADDPSLDADDPSRDAAGGASDESGSDEDDAPPAGLLVPGPVSFPTLPDAAEDLPHILDAPRRSIDREVFGAALVNQLKAEAADADIDEERARYLLDVTYDAEAWANVDLTDVRDSLETRTDGGS